MRRLRIGLFTAIAAIAVVSNGSSANLNLAPTPTPGTAAADASFDLDFSATALEQSGATKLVGMRFTNITGSRRPNCPTATGKLALKTLGGGTMRNAETFGAARVHPGTVREATSVTFRATADGQMGADARLKPIPFSATVGLDYSRSAAELTIFGSRSREADTVTITGTIDPVSGQISGGTVTSNIKASGFTGASDAAAAASFKPILVTMANDYAGRVLKSLKQAEARARNGECTRIKFVPGSPSPLAPRASKRVQAKLVNKAGNPLRVASVRWTAVPVKGSVTPRTSKAKTPTFNVKGASTGPQTAKINVKAVSPAGISQGTWIGTSRSPRWKRSVSLPPSYSGTVSLTQDLSVGGMPFAVAWAGTFGWKKTEQRKNPDRSIYGLYSLTTASLSSLVYSGTCSGAAPTTGSTIMFGDLEIQIDPAGTWTSAFVVDVATAPFPVICPEVQLIDTSGGGKAFLNSRTTAPVTSSSSGLRSMTPNGPITGTAVTDTNASLIFPSTADWSLTPGT